MTGLVFINFIFFFKPIEGKYVFYSNYNFFLIKILKIFINSQNNLIKFDEPI